MHKLAAAMAVAVVVAVILVGSAPTDAEGSATGPASDAGASIILLCMVLGIVIVVAFKKPRAALAGTESVLARRDTRERYRQLVEKDRPLARSMHVGRPDVSRD